MNHVATDQQSMARELLLGQAAGLAFSVYHDSGFSRLDPKANDLTAAQSAYQRHDWTAVRGILSRLSEARQHIPPADVSLDAVYPEAWLLANVGDTTGALRLINPTLDAVRDKPAREWLELANAGALLRTIQLRVRLQSGLGNTSDAKIWARALLVLSGGRCEFQAVPACRR